MTAITFIVILAVLIFVHELGHFLFAKRFGVRVDEFALGFPPKIWSRKIGETLYSLNLVPFGGFVKIFGENPDEESLRGPNRERSFTNKNRAIQAAILFAGVLFNIMFGWLLLSIGFVSGLPASAGAFESAEVTNVRLIITSVLPGSAAARVALKEGDEIMSLRHAGAVIDNPTAPAVQEFVRGRGGMEITVMVSRQGVKRSFVVRPEIYKGETEARIGITMDLVGIVRLSVSKAVIEGAKSTIHLIQAVSIGLYQFAHEALLGQAVFKNISGPIGIASMVGNARELGFAYLLSFTAFISLNLAVINLAPFPALDGGRIVVVAIEAIIRRRINPKITNTLNAIGFSLLIILMFFITWKDISRLSF